MVSMIIPRILLVGAGRFGRRHIRVLQNLEKDGLIEFVGVVVKTEKSRQKIEKEFKLKTYKNLTPQLLKSVTAVDIVTPPESHFSIVKNCLKYTNVFVEKPLTLSVATSSQIVREAQKYKRILMVGHIFRYHPVTKKLKEILTNRKMPSKIDGSFINPVISDQGRSIPMDLLHLFDIIDFLWPIKPEIVHTRSQGRISIVDLRYPSHCDARLVLGWREDEKKRLLTFHYPNLKIEADFTTNTILITSPKLQKKIQCQSKKEPLQLELEAFIGTLLKSKKNLSDGTVGQRIVDTAERALSRKNQEPRVAVIGGGIFGTSIAAELSKFFKVGLFERNTELLQEGSFINQFRHHYGYHYPRSDETVFDIQRSRKDFEKIFSSAIKKTPTYYAIHRKDSLVSPKEFLAFCRKHALPYRRSFPHQDLLARESIALSVKVPEPSYEHHKLKKITEERLKSSPNVKVFYKTPVIGVKHVENGQKMLTYIKNTRKQKLFFDFIINATYANINLLTHWLKSNHHPIRVDLAEVLIIKLPIPPVSITVVDGPFATLMPTGNPNEFTLYHVKESILDRYVPEKGLIKRQKRLQSNKKAILKESTKLFPILKDAVIVETRIVHRGVQAHREHDDARVAELIDHGFGCWSILSGKILSSVSMGKRLAKILKSYQT